LERSSRDLIEVLPQNLPGATEENSENLVRVPDILAATGTEYLASTNLDDYFGTYRLGFTFYVTYFDHITRR
jgi:hypothetical protein